VKAGKWKIETGKWKLWPAITEERQRAVILSEAKNLSSFGLSEQQRSFVACTSSG